MGSSVVIVFSFLIKLHKIYLMQALCLEILVTFLTTDQ